MKKLAAILLGCLLAAGCAGSSEVQQQTRDRAKDRGFTVDSLEGSVESSANVSFGTCTGKLHPHRQVVVLFANIPNMADEFKMEDPTVEKLRAHGAVKRECFSEEK